MFSLYGRMVFTITKANSQNYFLTTTYRSKFHYEHPWWQDLVYPDDIRRPCPRVSKHAGGYRGQNFPYGGLSTLEDPCLWPSREEEIWIIRCLADGSAGKRQLLTNKSLV